MTRVTRRRRRHAASAPAALACAVLACCAARRAGADFAFASFSVAEAPPDSLSLVGIANRTGDRLRLTPPLAGTAGGVWCAPRR
jgi:hypothetical protein